MSVDESVVSALAGESWRLLFAPEKSGDAEETRGHSSRRRRKKGGVLVGAEAATRQRLTTSQNSYLYAKCLVREDGYSLMVSDCVRVWACQVDYSDLAQEKEKYNPQLDVDTGAVPSMLERHFLTPAASLVDTTRMERSVDDESMLHIECACAIDFYQFVWEFVCYPLPEPAGIIRDHLLRPLLLVCTMQSQQLRQLSSALAGQTTATPIPLDGSFDEAQFNLATLSDTALERQLHAPSLGFLEDSPALMIAEFLQRKGEHVFDPQPLPSESDSQSTSAAERTDASQSQDSEVSVGSDALDSIVLTPPDQEAKATPDVMSPSKKEYVESFEELQRRREIEEKVTRQKRKREEGKKSKKNKRIKLV
eukprot:TRINITY_DN13306_c0_g1_i1.p1 TRINITY_DN13306_c0_g1~~TRINITY_DN13306_c0_g1_i1.p1  ORF type:complete len:365 (+),score=106.97 TRINITY_DN13306_c0_g1_i1:156-1250(+)